MTPNEYQALAQRTVMSDETQKTKIVLALTRLPELSHVLVAALKLNSESGELSDALVKHISYGQPLDRENILEECGDLLWYIAFIVEKLGSDMETVMEANIEKLKIRYPEKFTEECAKERADKKLPDFMMFAEKETEQIKLPGIFKEPCKACGLIICSCDKVKYE